MIEGFEEAQAEIAEAAARDLHWFAPPDRKQFLGEAALSAFAVLLFSAFLAGFKEIAEKKAKEAGKKFAEYLWEAIADLFSDNKDSGAKKELEKWAGDAPRVAAGLTEEQRKLLSAEVEKELKRVLQNKLSPKQAEKLAARVRQSVVRHVLRKPRRE